MTILITGATGLIGRALTQALVDAGERPRVVTRRPHRALELFDSRVTAFEWHPRTEPLPAPALEGVERVIHLMGEPLYGPLTRAKRARIVASRRIGARRLIEALGRTRIHLIAASSTAVYGHGQGPPITEASALQKPRDKLALALLGCEDEAARLRENGSIVTLVRFGPVIAPGTFPEPLRALFDRRLAWRSPDPDAAVPAIDLADALALLTWLAQSRPLPGPIHAVAPEPLRTADLEQLLAQVSLSRTRARLPRWLLRRQVGALADMLYSRQRILPKRALDAGFKFSRPDALEGVRAVLAQHAPQPAKPRASLPGAARQRERDTGPAQASAFTPTPTGQLRPVPPKPQ